MQAELAAAHVQIHRSEGRLRDSVANLTELEQNVRRSFGPGSWTEGPTVAAVEARAAAAAPAAAAVAEAAASAAAPATAPEAAQQQQRPAAPAARAAQPRSGSRPGLASRGKPGLVIPEQLKDFWFPVEFSASLVEDRMVPFELFGDVRRCCRCVFVCRCVARVTFWCFVLFRRLGCCMPCVQLPAWHLCCHPALAC